MTKPFMDFMDFAIGFRCYVENLNKLDTLGVACFGILQFKRTCLFFDLLNLFVLLKRPNQGTGTRGPPRIKKISSRAFERTIEHPLRVLP